MQQNNQNLVIIIPRELVFTDVSPHSTYEQSFIIKNRQTNQSFDLFFDAYDQQKYQMTPNRIQLKPHQEQLVVVKLQIDQITQNYSFKDEITIKDSNSNAQIILPVTLLPSQQISQLSPHHSLDQDYISRDEDEEIFKNSFSQGQMVSQDYSKLQYPSYERELQDSQGMSLMSQSNYRDNQVQAYKKIIDEKDRLIEKLESELLIERERYENIKVELNSSMETEKINIKMSSLLKDANPDITKAIELAVQKERIENEKKNQKVLELFQQKDKMIFEKENRVNQLQNIVQELENMNRQLNNRIQELEVNFEEYQKNSLANSQKEFFKDIQTLQNEINGYKQELEQRSIQQELLNEEIQLAQKRIEEYEQISKKESQLIEDLKTENLSLLASLEEYGLKEKYWQEYYERKMSESKTLSDRVDDYRNIQEEIMKMSDEHQRQIDTKDEEIKVISHELYQTQQQCQILKQQIEEMQQQYETIKNSVQRQTFEYENKEKRESMDKNEQSIQSDQRNQKRLQAQDISNSPALQLNEYNQQRIAQLENELNQIQINYNLMNGQLNEEKKSRKQLQEKLNEMQIENNHLQDEIQSQQKYQSSNNQNLTAKYEQVLKQLEISERQRKNIEDGLQKTRELKVSQQQIGEEDYPTQIKLLKIKNDQLEKNQIKIIEDKARIEMLYNDLQSEFNQVKTEFSNPAAQLASGNIHSANNRMSFTSNQPDQFNSRQDESQNLQKIESLKKTIAELEAAIDKSEDKDKETKKKIVILEKEKENLQQNLKHMSNLIDDLEYKSKEIEDRYRTDLIDLQQKNLEFQDTIYQLERQTTSQREEIEDSSYLKEKIEIISKVNQKFETDIKQLKLKNQEEMQELKYELDNLDQVKSRLERRLEEYEHDNKILTKTNDEKDIIINKLNDENEDLDHRCKLLMAENSKINELNRKYGIEIERVYAQLNASKEQTEWAEAKFKEILREKEETQKELNILEIQTKHTDVVDAKVIEELNDLRESMRRLAFEKERLKYQLKISDDEYNKDEANYSQKIDVFKFMKQIELKIKTLENDSNSDIQQLKSELANSKREFDIQQQQYNDLKVIVDKKEQDYLKVTEEKRILNNDLNKQKDQQIEIQRQVDELSMLKQLEDKQKNETIQQLQFDLLKQEESVQVMREEMLNQNKAFMEVKSSQEGASTIMKQKFITDVNELYQKFNTFVNQIQTEQSKKNGTTNVKDDKKYISRLIETYAENVNIVSHKEALIKKLQDKEKKMTEKEKFLTKEVERLVEANKKYAEEFQVMQKKGYTVSSVSKRIIPGQKSFNVLNDTNISKNPNKNQNINPNITQNDMSVSFVNQNDETQIKGTIKLKDITTLEAQLFTAKTNLEQCKEEIVFLKDYNKDLKEDIEKLQKREEDLLDENRNLQFKLQDQLKQNKVDKEKQLAEIEQVKTQYFTPDNYNEKIVQLEQKDKVIKELKDDVNRKKDLVQSVKQLKEEQSYDMKTLQVEIERLQKELEKYKIRANKATQALSGPTKEIKAQIENLKAVEKKLTQENEELQEQLKKQRAELTRQNVVIKELRGKLDQSEINGQQLNENSEQLGKTKDQLKKIKNEVDRKETSIKTLKTKLDNATQELEDQKSNTKNFVSKNDFLIEQKKNDQAKQTIKKSEAQISMLVFLLKRIFRDSFVNLQKLKSSNKPIASTDFGTQNTRSQGAPNNKFSDSVNILGLSPEEIDQFIDPYSQSQKNVQSQQNYNTSQASEFYSDLMDRFEKELENIDENINVNSIYQMLFSVIEERVEIIKSSKK